MSFNSYELSQYDGEPIDCYRFISGAQEWLYTSNATAFALEGGDHAGTFVPNAITHTEPSQGQDSPGQIRITLPANDPLVEFFLNGVPAMPIQVNIYRVHRPEPSAYRIMFMGEVTSDDSDLPVGSFLVDPMIGRFSLKFPRGLYQREQCIWTLGQAGTCDLTLTPFILASTVTAVTGVRVTVDGAADFGGDDPDYFSLGVLGFGEYRVHIEKQDGDVMRLQTRIPSLIIGSEVELLAGDDHSLTTCRDKFVNAHRMMAFPNLPLANVWYGRGLV